MDAKDPFGYPWGQYAEVAGLACAAGLIKYLNTVQEKRWLRMFIALATSGFTGVMTFWLCESLTIRGPMSALLISAGGLSGATAWRELENLWRLRLGLPVAGTPSKDKDEAPK